jgi:hypothetical protein
MNIDNLYGDDWISLKPLEFYNIVMYDDKYNKITFPEIGEMFYFCTKLEDKYFIILLIMDYHH